MQQYILFCLRTRYLSTKLKYTDNDNNKYSDYSAA